MPELDLDILLEENATKKQKRLEQMRSTFDESQEECVKQEENYDERAGAGNQNR